ncbi:alpha/beta hydrolase [Ktedonosporobacter rubrisoli]|uniref:Alpha/beta hydrolase n=1 Tax=Ktedonosporobacter rubrisoli TaxID=2509675 RepID=A0A4V0YZW0_KTERU|nr:alpha/beta hydrolase [Ktedonosporobacter rubrisoli]QBD81091.1 alpha/beta hydrolase [Ktedonosporobacter rubrisoli]
MFILTHLCHALVASQLTSWRRGKATVSPRRDNPLCAGLALSMLLGVLALSSCGRASSLATANKARTPSKASTTFVKTATCPFQPGEGIILGQELTCGILTVPENRANPGGHTIQLAVAIFTSPQHTADRTPILRLDGGPGGASLSTWAASITGDAISQQLLSHDWIAIDQRGTGFSQPSLACPELAQASDTSADQDKQAQATAQQQALRSCYERLTSEGIDLSAYTTLENAADMHDLVQALGYQQVNLYGISYGTRLALTMMRLYPEQIRSVVLDGVYPPQVGNQVDQSQAFQTLFQGCMRSTVCERAYPHLAQDFVQAANLLDVRPAETQIKDDATGNTVTARIDGNEFRNLMFLAMYPASLLPQLPALIEQTKQGNYDPLKQLYTLFNTAVGETISWGMHFSVECSESFMMDVENELDPCAIWKVPRVPVEQKQPVHSALPTLLTSGRYDPVTPPSNAQAAAATLSRSYSLVFPNAGHGVLDTSTCANQIIEQFYDTPGSHPDTGCLNELNDALAQSVVGRM